MYRSLDVHDVRHPPRETPRYDLTPGERDQMDRAVRTLRGRATVVGAPRTVDSARLLNGSLPEGLIAALEDFRRFGNDAGVLTVRNLPVPAGLPPTPTVPNSVPVDCGVSVAVLLLVMSRLGDPISYTEEKHGALVHDICPVPGEEEQQQNTGSVYFELHTENAFHANRPDFVGLLCLRPDHERRAASITSSIREALHLLSAEEAALLRQPRFRTRLAPSFCRDADVRPYLAPAPVLGGTSRYPTMTVDFDDTAATDEEAERALVALHGALQRVRRESVLLAGDLSIIDNSTTVHGRSAFTPCYDGQDRWLQRMFVVHSLRGALDVLAVENNYRCRPLAVPR
ncbi:TauD/TfdA family dioxygenase [Micromonospora echinofusca]|uniref:L-asparagine oxygenase n=1 Tax=Micromonospora echinofusca TaxID=47858 RepID=A0ABS3VTG0_MICEH|nr:TauD/TfdA family dioxygenase [Micromonospora echinofusca]MBO4207824.1 L-asparagine oxygenase [Micromonospora echinofusca]